MNPVRVRASININELRVNSVSLLYPFCRAKCYLGKFTKKIIFPQLLPNTTQYQDI